MDRYRLNTTKFVLNWPKKHKQVTKYNKKNLIHIVQPHPLRLIHIIKINNIHIKEFFYPHAAAPPPRLSTFGDPPPTIALLWLCIHSLKNYFFYEVFRFWIIWTESLCRIAFINITFTFSIQLIYLLFHSSVMHYFFVRSLLENTLVTIELRNLRCRLFSHFSYICRFSLTTFIGFFACKL